MFWMRILAASCCSSYYLQPLPLPSDANMPCSDTAARFCPVHLSSPELAAVATVWHLAVHIAFVLKSASAGCIWWT